MAEPDLEIRAGGRGCRSQKKQFLPFGPQFGHRIREGPGPSPVSATA